MKLKKFDQIYNKFLFQWSQGNQLSNIIDLIKAQTTVNNIQNNEYIQPADDMKLNTIDNTEKIKNTFYEIFPSFMLHKCQNKFPLEDDTIIPNEIIDDFWNRYCEIILQKFSNTLVNNIANKLLDILIEIFGSQTTYNENIFNKSVMKLVKLNIN